MMSLTHFVKRESAIIYSETGKFAFLLVSAVMMMVIGPFPHIPMAHVPLMALGVLLCLTKNPRFDSTMLILLLYIPFGIVISRPDPVFRSWERFVLFMMLVVLVSPLFRNLYAIKLRRQILFAYLGYCVIVAVGSFVCYIIGINYMRNVATGEMITELNSPGGFGGLTMQSMTLGPLCGFSALYMFYRMLLERDGKIWYLIIIVVSTLTLLFSASRSALLATLAGGIVLLYQSKRNSGTFLKSLLGLTLVAALTFPLWETATTAVIAKHESNKELGQYGSRTEKWAARISEFESSPLFGVGFAAQDPQGKDYYDKKSGTIEPGCSWLAILAMTGLIGLFLFINVILRPLKLWRQQSTPYNALMLGLLTLLFVHMVAEGYIYAGGSALCFIAWVIIGCTTDAFEQSVEICHNK